MLVVFPVPLQMRHDIQTETDRFSLAVELEACLKASFVNPRSAWENMCAFKARHGVDALVSELATRKRRRFGREPGGRSSGMYFTDEGRQLRQNAEIAKQTLPALIAAHFAIASRD